MTKYPLSWPFGWRRTKYPDSSRFGKVSFAIVRDNLFHELELLRASSIILSTNIELRLDGIPYANQSQPNDKGVAVYFKLKGEERVLACDKWNKIEHNLRAIEKHISALRGQERWGVGTIDQAFTGYTSIPRETTVKKYFEGVRDVRAHWIKLCKEMHPDKGGNSLQFSEMNSQYRALSCM